MALDSRRRNGFSEAESGQENLLCFHSHAFLASQKEDEMSLSKYA